MLLDMVICHFCWSIMENVRKWPAVISSSVYCLTCVCVCTCVCVRVCVCVCEREREGGRGREKEEERVH